MLGRKPRSQPSRQSLGLAGNESSALAASHARASARRHRAQPSPESYEHDDDADDAMEDTAAARSYEQPQPLRQKTRTAFRIALTRLRRCHTASPKHGLRHPEKHQIAPRTQLFRKRARQNALIGSTWKQPMYRTTDEIHAATAARRTRGETMSMLGIPG